MIIFPRRVCAHITCADSCDLRRGIMYQRRAHRLVGDCSGGEKACCCFSVRRPSGEAGEIQYETKVNVTEEGERSCSPRLCQAGLRCCLLSAESRDLTLVLRSAHSGPPWTQSI